MTSLLERVALAETAALRQAEDLRAQLVAVEERLQRLAITRETLTEFAGDHLSDADMPEDDAGAEEESSQAAHLDPAEEPSPLPPLRGFRQQVVALPATADEPMRTREIVQAIGKPDTRSQVEGMRSRLQRLVTDGWLRRRHADRLTGTEACHGTKGAEAARGASGAATCPGDVAPIDAGPIRASGRACRSSRHGAARGTSPHS